MMRPLAIAEPSPSGAKVRVALGTVGARKRHITLLVALVLALAAPAAQEAQEIPALERIIHRNIMLRPPLNHCGAASVTAAIAGSVGLPAGVEYLPGACNYRLPAQEDQGSWIPLIGLTVGEALERLKAFDPRYHWVESDGVLIVRPIEAWGDEEHPLHESIGEFAADEEHAGILLHRLRSRLTGAREPHPWEIVPRTPEGAKPLTLHLTAASAILALDAIVRAHGALVWTVEWCKPERRREYATIRLSTFGFGVTTSLLDVRPRDANGESFHPCRS